MQTQQWDQSREMAEHLQSSLQDIKEREIGALVLAVYGMRDQLVSPISPPDDEAVLKDLSASLQ